LTLGDPAQNKDKKEGRPAPPPWLTAPALGEAQRGLQPRAQELLARLKAGTERAAQAAQPGQNGQPGQPGQTPPVSQPPQGADEARKARVLQAAREAIPEIDAAVSAMDRAAASLAGDLLEPAARAQAEAMAGLLKALERFGGVRELIELAHGEQSQAVALLTPPGSEAGKGQKLPAALQALSTQERAALLAQGAARNLDRVARLKGLLADELLALAEKGAAQGQAQGQGQPEQAEAERERVKQAEAHRAKAEAAIKRLAGQVNGKGQSAGARASAAEALAEIEALRRLYFTLIEHLKEVLREQVETHDGTGAAQALKDEDEKRRRLGPLSQAQARHAALGKALGEALSAQADQAAQAGQAGQAGQGDAAEAQKRLGEAAQEVRKGAGEMEGAAGRLERDLKEPVSPDLEPALAQQKQAIAHLEQALRILEPPPPPEQKDQKDQKDQKQQEQQQVSQEQAARRLQAIREREAERQRAQRQKAAPEPVEKDW
jgi:hypothetical protein